MAWPLQSNQSGSCAAVPVLTLHCVTYCTLLQPVYVCPAVWDATTSVWSNKVPEAGAAPRRLALQNDGNLVLYDAHNLGLWQTNTAGMLDQFDGQLLT